MESTYVRLLDAARELKQWNGPAEISRGVSKAGYELSEQVLSNWKIRGVSVAGAVMCARIFGARVEYILSGTLPIKDNVIQQNISPAAMRAAYLINDLPEYDQVRLLHYLQVRADQATHSAPLIS